MATNPNDVAPAGYVDWLAKRAMSPGWAKREPQMWPKPRRRFVPTVWRYAEALEALTKATAFVSTEFAERRNLIMVNPIEDNIYPTCRHLVAAYQLVLPGETARSHRHSPNALRLVLDGTPGLYTLVDGVRVDMAPGDVVLTPQWHWHGHANYSDKPAFWLDFLDVPLVQNMENMFFEHHPDTLETVQSEAPDSPYRFRGEVLTTKAAEQSDHAFAQEHMPTIGLHMLHLADGQAVENRGQICNDIYAVTAGSVTFDVDTLGPVVLERGDVIVVPSWYAFSLKGNAESATVLRVTDEPVFTKLGFRDLDLEP